MKNKHTDLVSTIAGIVAFGATAAQAVPDQPKNREKCAGVAKVGKNDCGSLDGKHNCAGKSTEDNSQNEWVYLPEGTCTKISDGTVAGIKPAK